MPDYHSLTRDELLNLAQERNQLTDEARQELDAELSLRNVTPNETTSYSRATISRRKTEEGRKRSDVVYETRNKQFFGKKNRATHPQKRIEEFDTTLWFVISVPLIPLFSCRVRRFSREGWKILCPGRVHVLEKRTRDWEQILRTWLKTVLVVAAAILGLWIFLHVSFPSRVRPRAAASELHH
jgi:hypothetical protein